METDSPLEKADGMQGIEGWDDAARGWWTFLNPPEETVNVDLPLEDVDMVTEKPSEEKKSERSSKKPPRQSMGKGPKKQQQN